MTYRSKLDVSADDSPLVLIVEPWAYEFTLNPGERCAVVAIRPKRPPTFTVSVSRGSLIVWVNEGATTFEFVRDGNIEFETDNPTPGYA